jgi:hypothetical protein
MTKITIDQSRIAKVKTLHRDIESRHREIILFARQAGDELRAIRDEVGHGNWKPWVKQNLREMSIETAQVYMRVAKHWDKIAPEVEKNKGLSLAAALRILRMPKEVEAATAEKLKQPVMPAVASKQKPTRAETDEPASASPFATAAAQSKRNVHCALDKALENRPDAVLIKFESICEAEFKLLLDAIDAAKAERDIEAHRNKRNQQLHVA